MGGTSFDVGLVVGDRPVVSQVTEVAQYHVSVPMVDITAIGAGGGSIAEVVAGELRVGPKSAGPSPAPFAIDAVAARSLSLMPTLHLVSLIPKSFSAANES
jgi:N-methylhydantoinase A/oxoprolinase/acetone carboxylase beta subunit